MRRDLHAMRVSKRESSLTYDGRHRRAFEPLRRRDRELARGNPPVMPIGASSQNGCENLNKPKVAVKPSPMVSSIRKVSAFVATPREPVKAGPALEENVDVVNSCAVIAGFVRGFRKTTRALSCFVRGDDGGACSPRRFASLRKRGRVCGWGGSPASDAFHADTLISRSITFPETLAPFGRA
jgi:hypothetical protein